MLVKELRHEGKQFQSLQAVRAKEELRGILALLWCIAYLGSSQSTPFQVVGLNLRPNEMFGLYG